MVGKILAYMIYFSPYVFCICLLAEYVITLVNIKREKKLEEERRKEMNRAIYILSLEIRRLNNRLLSLVAVSVWNTLNDPTTKGLGDSERAKSYTDPQ